MKLISCPECGKQISVNATKCVHCGFPLPLKTCPECGVQYNAVLLVCPQCGYDEVAAKEQAEQLAKQQAEQARIATERRAIKVAKAKRIGSIVGIIIFAVAAIVIVVFVSIHYLNDKEIKQQKQLHIEAAKKQGFVNLGLPSGTMWKNENEEGFYTYSNAIEIFRNRLPSEEQFEELQKVCEWVWLGNGYKVIGPNYESIILPADGWCYPNKTTVENIGSIGHYWTSKPYFSSGYYLSFDLYGNSITGDGLSAVSGATVVNIDSISERVGNDIVCKKSVRLVCTP